MIESLIEKTASLSKDYIDPIAKEIGVSNDFPSHIWKKLGETGILGLGVPVEYGGTGSCAADISAALHELVFKGGNLGLGVSVLIHNIVAKYVIVPFAGSDAKKRVLPLMADGMETCSFAVSEPGRGGHPKFIEALAERKDGSFSIKGEKSYLTNGPIAGFFVVIAVSGEDSGRKRFTALLVPSGSEGLEKTPSMKIPFFRPSPHGGIKLDGVNVSVGSIIGKEGKAYDDIVIPFRDIENAIMAGPVSGAIRRLTTEASKIAKNLEKNPDNDVFVLLGRMKAVSGLATDLSKEMALALDRGDEKEMQQDLYFRFREVCSLFNNLIESWDRIFSLDKISGQSNEIYEILKTDLLKSAGLGEYILKTNLAKSGKLMLK